jgi:hypothetical protein
MMFELSAVKSISMNFNGNTAICALYFEGDNNLDWDSTNIKYSKHGEQASVLKVPAGDCLKEITVSAHPINEWGGALCITYMTILTVGGHTQSAGRHHGGATHTFKDLDTNGYGMKVRSGAGIDSVGIFYAE